MFPFAKTNQHKEPYMPCLTRIFLLVLYKPTFSIIPSFEHVQRSLIQPTSIPSSSHNQILLVNYPIQYASFSIEQVSKPTLPLD